MKKSFVYKNNFNFITFIGTTRLNKSWPRIPSYSSVKKSESWTFPDKYRFDEFWYKPSNHSNREYSQMFVRVKKRKSVTVAVNSRLKIWLSERTASKYKHWFVTCPTLCCRGVVSQSYVDPTWHREQPKYSDYIHELCWAWKDWKYLTLCVGVCWTTALPMLMLNYTYSNPHASI